MRTSTILVTVINVPRFLYTFYSYFFNNLSTKFPISCQM
jgi:hypothetical protein